MSPFVLHIELPENSRKINVIYRGHPAGLTQLLLDSMHARPDLGLMVLEAAVKWCQDNRIDLINLQEEIMKQRFLIGSKPQA